jgi:tetratricopeptide (TPR) repeat protein
MGREQVTGNSHPSGPFTTASIGATVHAEDNPPHDAVPHPRGPSLALSTITTYLAPDSPFQEQTPRHHSPSTSPSVEEARLFERLETLEAKYGAGSEPIFNVLEEVCQFHFSEGRYQLAETGITKLIAASRRVCGEHDKRTGIALSFLGKILGAQGHYPRAMKTCQEASHILEQTLGPHDESTLSNSLVIGYLFYEMKDYGEAVQLFRPLKDTALRELGPMHSLSVKISMYFSISLITMGEYTEAEQLLESILYGTQGKNPSVPAWVLRRSRLAYGSLLMKTSRCEEAVDIVEEIFYEETAANGRDIPLL